MRTSRRDLLCVGLVIDVVLLWLAALACALLAAVRVAHWLVTTLDTGDLLLLAAVVVVTWIVGVFLIAIASGRGYMAS